MTIKNRSKPTKKCHWVPQAYLNRFSVVGDGPSKIWTYTQDGKDPVLKPVEKVAVKFYLYVPKDDKDLRDDSFEKRLSTMENWLGHNAWDFLATKEVDLNCETIRMMVSLTVATMYLRNPNTFDRFGEMHSQIRDEIMEYGSVPDAVSINGKTVELEPSSWPEFRDADENDIKKIWLEEVGNAGALAKELMKMRWSMLCLETPSFVTSDNPVTLIHPSLKFKGFQNPESSVYFPLSPTRLLLFDHLHDEPANQYYSCKYEGAVPNLLAWRGAIQNIFSPNEGGFVFSNLLINEKLQ